MNDSKQAQEIADLKRQLAEIKQALPTKPVSDAEVAAHRDWVHQMNESRATRAASTLFTRDQLAAFAAACPGSMAQDIVKDNRAPQGPSTQSPSSQPAVSDVRVGGSSGWSKPIPIRNGIGQGR